MERIREIDVLKGIGIISVVIGHSFGFIIPIINVHSLLIINTYQIFLFLFTSGGVYHKGKSYKIDIGKRIVSLGTYNFCYNLFFVLMHNLFIHVGILDAEHYSIGDVIEKVINGLALSTSESMLGAFWFIPMLMFAMIFFIVFWNFAENRRYKYAWHILFVMLSIIIGYLIKDLEIYNQVGYHMMISFMGVPVIYFGKLFFAYKEIGEKALTWYGMLIAIAVIILSIKQQKLIGLSTYTVPNPIWFYSVTACGIYFCLYLTKWILKNSIATKWISCVGENSLHIMALHFFAFKIIDFFLINTGIFNAEKYELSRFPTSGLPLGAIYTIIGVLLPLGIVMITKKISKCYMNYNKG